MAVCKYHRVNIEHLTPTALYPVIMLHAPTRRTLQTCYFVNMFINNVNKYIMYYYYYHYYYYYYYYYNYYYLFNTQYILIVLPPLKAIYCKGVLNVLSFYFEFITTDCALEPDHSLIIT